MKKFILGDTDWRVQALCAQIDPEMFFPEKDGNTKEQARRAKQICSECPVRTECLQEALRLEGIMYGGRFGIWGGTTPHERAAMNHTPSLVKFRY